MEHFRGRLKLGMARVARRVFVVLLNRVGDADVYLAYAGVDVDALAARR